MPTNSRWRGKAKQFPLFLPKRRLGLGFLDSLPKFPKMPSPNLFLLLALLSLLLTVARSDTESDPSDVCRSLSDGSESGSSCPINCFRPDPVCGADGVTYWCGCPEAACAGVRVAKRGPCQVGNGGSGKVSGQAFLLIHIVWLIVLGFSVLCGFL